MKLWEVIKALTEDPAKKFEQRGPDWVETIWCEGGFLVYTSEFRGEVIDRGGITENAHLNECDWKLVRQPVPWQEAIQAWVEGKKKVTVSTPFGLESQEVKKSRGSIITEYEITNGTWYVED